MAALAAAVLAGILYTVASREPKEPRGYAEFTMFRDACLVERSRRLNVRECVRIRRGDYLIVFTKPLTDSTALATRGTGSPGFIAATIVDDFTVLVTIERRVRTPVRASVLVP